jgi:phage regulator Rha-like protein
MNRQQQTFTMSSREIAHLCEKQHKHILRDIENMIQDIDGSRFGPVDFEETYQDAKGEWRKE